MGISQFPPASTSALNSSVTFSSSGTWIVPSGVTSVYVELVGGYGGRSGNPSNTENTETSAGNGGDTSAFGLTASGGLGGRARHRGTNNSNGRIGLNEDGRPGERISLYVNTTPGASEIITIGAGGEGRVTISYSV